MNKWTFLKDMITGADTVIELVDARDVPGTRLPIAEKWAGSNRLLMVANKVDLLPKGATLPRLRGKGIYISAKNADENDRWDLIRAIMARAGKSNVKAIMVGYPNVGKSTIINMLARRKAAKVSPIAGTTKNIQWVKINDSLMVSDYRGMFPSKEPKEDLVRKGAINVEEGAEAYAYDFADKILASPILGKWFIKRFDIALKGMKDSHQLMEALARRRGFFMKGGEPNLEEAAKILIRAIKDAPRI